jgi:hypothetical protein
MNLNYLETTLLECCDFLLDHLSMTPRNRVTEFYIASRIHDIDTRWHSKVSFTIQALCSWEEIPGSHLLCCWLCHRDGPGLMQGTENPDTASIGTPVIRSLASKDTDWTIFTHL